MSTMIQETTNPADENAVANWRPRRLTLRSGSLADAEPAGAICYEAFKTISEYHQFPPDFPSPAVAIDLMQMLLSRPDVHSTVAEIGDRVVGSNFLWETGTVAGVGPITVDPDAQNRAVGRHLMEAVLDRARRRGIDAVRLVQAAYHSRSLSLYTKLGFVVREPVVVLQGPPLGLRLDGHLVRTATSDDVDAANALCRDIHGHDRTTELHYAVREGVARVVERAGRITGYTTGIGFFGHAVGETAGDVKALIAAAPSFPGPGFLLPIRSTELFRWCLDHRLKVVQPMTLMSIGPYQEPRAA